VSSIEIVRADLDRVEHQTAIIEMIDAYSRDPMGDERPLPEDVKQRLIPGLRNHPTTIVFLAFDGARPVGIAMCFLGFSSFYARPLINIHDLSVIRDYRGKGLGRQLLAEVAGHGRQLGCCKLTLETQEYNTAQHLYRSVGFARDVHTPEAGGAIFMTMKL